MDVFPLLHYEAYDIKFINNVIHDSQGAAFGVNGGYNITMAFNTAYRVGSRDHALEFVHGGHSRDGDSTACGQRVTIGGWGPSTIGTTVPVPNKNVFILNNIIYNPPGYQSRWSHFVIEGRTANVPNCSNLPAGTAGDDNLIIRGNVIYNGGIDMGLGIGSLDGNTTGCQDTNPTCNRAQLLTDNASNTFAPSLRAPESGDFSLLINDAILNLRAAASPSFLGGDLPFSPQAPTGDFVNVVTENFLGILRGLSPLPGAL